MFQVFLLVFSSVCNWTGINVETATSLFLYPTDLMTNFSSKFEKLSKEMKGMCTLSKKKYSLDCLLLKYYYLIHHVFKKIRSNIKKSIEISKFYV